MTSTAPQLFAASRDIDSARTSENGDIMIGLPHSKEKSYTTSAAEFMLNSISNNRQGTHRPVPEVLEKTLAYCKRFQSIGSEHNAMEVQKTIMRKVEYRDAREEDGPVKRMRRCKEFEAAQLINLMPTTPEEAGELIPTLKGNGFLPSLVEEIQTWRATDRGIGMMNAMDQERFD